MTQYEKKIFDSLNDTSYLFRVIFTNAGFDLGALSLNGTDCWHLYYRDAIIGSVTTRKWDGEVDSCTYTNLRLYKYFQDKFKSCKDFLMSEYFVFDNGKRIKFDFDSASKYISEIKTAAESLEVNKEKVDVEVDVLSDSIARLKEFCDEFDETFSKNTLFKDVKVLLNENERLEKEIEKYKIEKENQDDYGRSYQEERRAAC